MEELLLSLTEKNIKYDILVNGIKKLLEENKAFIDREALVLLLNAMNEEVK